jgi:aspartyl-tRNA(Asn)/glutamyl-tRNA(Gln) amidotransferase subunit A
LTGIGFGTNLGGKDFEEIITNNRTNNFMEQIKRRFTIGAYVSKSENFVKIFQRSKKLRTLLINAVNDILHDVDGYIMPGAAEIAPKMADVLANKGIDSKVDDMLLFANFAGLPSISIPVCKIDDMPWGINVTCKQFEDQKTLNIALTLENIFNYDGGSHE